MPGTVTFDAARALIELVDGGPGDFDGVFNGVIVDPSGPVTSASSSDVGGEGEISRQWFPRRQQQH